MVGAKDHTTPILYKMGKVKRRYAGGSLVYGEPEKKACSLLQCQGPGIL